MQKFEYLENEKSFLDEIKTSFIVFEGLCSLIFCISVCSVSICTKQAIMTIGDHISMPP